VQLRNGCGIFHLAPLIGTARKVDTQRQRLRVSA
jgi:hypothetical protein